jgi:hypothetical protein
MIDTRKQVLALRNLRNPAINQVLYALEEVQSSIAAEVWTTKDSSVLHTLRLQEALLKQVIGRMFSAMFTR